MRYVKIDNLKDGMVLVNAIYDNRDKILLRETNKINPLAIRKIRELGYAGVYIYDEDEGIPERGVEPGTPFSELSDAFKCPKCGVGKSMFKEVE